MTLHSDPLSYPPRGLSRTAAARYLSISPSKFDELVKDGRMPAPKRIDARVVWDRQALDLAFEALPGDSEEVDDWADVA